MIAERYPGLIDLPDEEKLALMAEFWDDLTSHTAADDPALAAFLESRWQDYQKNPGQASPWSEVKTRILASRP